ISRASRLQQAMSAEARADSRSATRGWSWHCAGDQGISRSSHKLVTSSLRAPFTVSTRAHMAPEPRQGLSRRAGTNRTMPNEQCQEVCAKNEEFEDNYYDLSHNVLPRSRTSSSGGGCKLATRCPIRSQGVGEGRPQTGWILLDFRIGQGTRGEAT